MLFYLTSRIVSSGVAYLYPGYASYKALSQRPASEDELERWLMYWSVLGIVFGVENAAEWLISWIPFYYTLKTLFLLYLVLPQTQGSSYLYVWHLQPFLASHETEIDAGLSRAKARAYEFIAERMNALWNQFAPGFLANAYAAQFAPTPQPEAAGAPPSMGDPASGPMAFAFNAWRSYAPSIIAAGTAMVQQGTVAAQTAAANANAKARESRLKGSRMDSGGSARDRRRKLEKELAELGEDDEEEEGEAVLVPRAAGASRRRGAKKGEAEGYEVEEHDESGSGGEASGGANAAGGGWWGWGAPAEKS